MPTNEEDVLNEVEGCVNLSIITEEQQGKGKETVRQKEMTINPSQNHCHGVIGWVLLPSGDFS